MIELTVIDWFFIECEEMKKKEELMREVLLIPNSAHPDVVRDLVFESSGKAECCVINPFSHI